MITVLSAPHVHQSESKSVRKSFIEHTLEDLVMISLLESQRRLSSVAADHPAVPALVSLLHQFENVSKSSSVSTKNVLPAHLLPHRNPHQFDLPQSSVHRFIKKSLHITDILIMVRSTPNMASLQR
jgi:hypothetical protein